MMSLMKKSMQTWLSRDRRKTGSLMMLLEVIMKMDEKFLMTRLTMRMKMIMKARQLTAKRRRKRSSEEGSKIKILRKMSNRPKAMT